MKKIRELQDKRERRLIRLCSIDIFDQPDPPRPDPAIGAAAQGNVELGRESLAFQKEQFADAKARQEKFDPLVQRVADQQIRIGDKNEAAADDYLGYMKTVFRPMEESLAKDAMEFDTEGKRAELAGKAASEVEQGAALSDESARREAARYGINPGDGAFTDNLAGSNLNKTILKIGAMGDARTKARAEGRAFKFDVAGLGRGLPGAGATASNIALNAGRGSVDTGAMPLANARADIAQMGTGFTQAGQLNSSGGSLYSNVFDAQMKGYDAQQQARAGLYQGLGTAAGMGVSAYFL